MALANQVMGGGFSAGQARAIGGTANVSVSAAGSVQGDATLLNAGINIVADANGTKGVILPLGEIGDKLTVFNNAASTLKVYPPSGAAIAVPGTGLGSANAAFLQVTYSEALYECVSPTQWTVVSSAGFSGSTASFTTITADAIAGGDASLGITGLASTQGGAVVVTGGTSSTSGNAGGASSIVGGTPGATGAGGAASLTAAAGGATSGIGGQANVTAGAGTAGNASGGSVVITPGAAHGSGIAGVIYQRGLATFKQGAPAALTTTATITAAQVIGGLITANQGGTAAATYTFCTGTELAAALPATFTTGDSFLFRAVNISTDAGEDVTFAGDTGTTMVGNVTMAANSGVTEQSWATFLVRMTGANAFSLYRVG